MTDSSPEAWQFPPSDEAETKTFSKEKEIMTSRKSFSGRFIVLSVFIKSINGRVPYIDVVADVVPDVVVMSL